MMSRDEWFDSLSHDEKGRYLKGKPRKQSWGAFWDEQYKEYVYNERDDEAYREDMAWLGRNYWRI